MQDRNASELTFVAGRPGNQVVIRRFVEMLALCHHAESAALRCVMQSASQSGALFRRIDQGR
jgi:hypothetical protein